jgi:putative ABC transport system permease protein
MGTDANYFRHFRYGRDEPLRFDSGEPFSDLYETVVGAEVADELGYEIGEAVVISHGLVSTQFGDHSDKPFTVVGILERTGTPVDRTVHVSLEGIEAIHVDWDSGARMPLHITAEQARKFDLEPQTITAFMIGLENRIETFQLQRKINEYREEPLLAIVPGVTLADLWRSISAFEQVLTVLAALVLAAGLVGMLTTILSTLNERRREMAVLRAVGAHPYQIILLFVLETLFVVSAGCLLGMAMLYLLLVTLHPLLARQFGINITLTPPDMGQWGLIAVAILLGGLVSLIPGFIAYRRSLQDGLAIKI